MHLLLTSRGLQLHTSTGAQQLKQPGRTTSCSKLTAQSSCLQASAAAAPTLSSLSEAAQPYWDSAHKVVSPHANVAYQRGSQYASQAYEVSEPQLHKAAAGS